MKESLFYICYFCKRRCQIGKMFGETIHWGCSSCRSTFRVSGNNVIHTIELWTMIRGKRYKFSITPEIDQADLTDEKGHHIHHFSSVPNITPQNIESKITTILTFL